MMSNVLKATVASDSRSPTPPNVPTYGVKVSSSEAQQILACGFPESRLLTLQSLPKGSFYNNRVYTLSYTVGASSTVTEGILKVCGSESKLRKSYNEVAALRLIQTQRPGLLVPRVLAWSGQDEVSTAITSHAWILMSKLPGESLDRVQDTDTADLESIFADVASFLASLRTIPIQMPGMGNFIQSGSDHRYPELGAPVDTTIDCSSWPKQTYLDFVTASLLESLDLLKNGFEYRENAHVVPSLKDFMANRLPHLALFQNPLLKSASVLTNGDLSAKNLLVARPVLSEANGQTAESDNTAPRAPLRLSGVVDWEYAGFFSPLEEYFSASEEMFDLEAHPDDGIDDQYAKILLPALAACGVDTPEHGALAKDWAEALALFELRTHVSAWWIGIELDDEERRRELALSAERMRVALEKLGWSFDGNA